MAKKRTEKPAPSAGLNDRELASVLAGLRLVQHYNDGTKPHYTGIEAILSNDEEFEALSNEEIDVLCMRLNSGELSAS
jgi:hypothetical protein